VLDELPLSPNGKVDRRALPAPDSSISGLISSIPARDALEGKLVRLYENVLGLENLGVQDNFFTLGGHSLLALRLRAEIEREFGVNVPMLTLFQESTVEQMAVILRKEGAASGSSTLIPLSRGERKPLFLVHAVGGTVHSYLELARALGDQPVYALQAPGIEGQSEPLQSVVELASRYVAEIRTVQPEGPYWLGGWSFGGLVAYEMAQQLAAQQQEVAMLTLIDSFAPNPQTGQNLDEKALLLEFGRDLAGQFGQETAAALEQLVEVDDLYGALQKAQDLKVLPPSLQQEDVLRLFAVYKANRLAMESYTPAPYNGRVTLLKAAEGSADLQQADDSNWGGLAPTLEVQSVPGDHFTLIQPPNVDRLAASIRRALTSNGSEQ
ncbi:alpha/beta fold hydrolase, partial [Tumebacillus flagellatus]